MSPSSRRENPSFRPGLSFVLLTMFLATLWFAGGASRADTLGQVVVRTAAWLILMILALAGKRPLLSGVRPVALLLAASLALVLFQLVPLPSELWQALPGRRLLMSAVIGEQPWRPWTMVPGATLNAASSLVVPLTTLLLLAGVSRRDHNWLLTVLLFITTASMLLGLLQFSGARFLNPLLNATLGQVSGSFANRNHFALFLAIGCLLTPVWIFERANGRRWRASVGFVLVLLFVLTILATGSRAGLLIGVIALAGGIAFSWHPLRQELRHAPGWVLPALFAAIATIVITLVIVSVAADRASSIQRAVIGDENEDMRTRGLPTVLAMIAIYFPAGSGFGGFDPLFRIHEPFTLLKPTYFNHAHNDFLEIALDGGLPAVLLLLVALGWWLLASVRAWRAPWNEQHLLARLGSAILLLIFIASAFDYPGRTPIMMAIIVIAATWLAQAGKVSPRFALPARKQHL